MPTFPVAPEKLDPDEERRFRRYLEQELESIRASLGDESGGFDFTEFIEGLDPATDLANEDEAIFRLASDSSNVRATVADILAGGPLAWTELETVELASPSVDIEFINLDTTYGYDQYRLVGPLWRETTDASTGTNIWFRFNGMTTDYDGYGVTISSSVNSFRRTFYVTSDFNAWTDFSVLDVIIRKTATDHVYIRGSLDRPGSTGFGRITGYLQNETAPLSTILLSSGSGSLRFGSPTKLTLYGRNDA